MTTAPRTNRCDQILSLIDECLAEFDSGLRLIPGQGDRVAFPSTPTRHLSLVRSL